ncbi:MAG TPA: ATP-dependent metallopeptidase FtsH/Yme1/Tma family protein, partial [Sphingomonas sp.]|nr:ATP-dependent metallopeptidase FtsH/Yme1/Tma family protein [Sphingomonas sp.]
MNDQDKPQGPDAGGPNPWMKHLLIWVGILVAGALFVTMLDGRAQTAGVAPMTYSAFLDKVEQGGVQEVNVTGAVITGKLKDGGQFRTNALLPDPTLVDKLRKNSVQITAKPEDGAPLWQLLLYQSLPFLLMVGLAFFVIRQMQKGSGSGAMGFGKSRAKMLTQREGKVTFDDVAGIDEAREELQEIVEFLK